MMKSQGNDITNRSHIKFKNNIFILIVGFSLLLMTALIVRKRLALEEPIYYRYLVEHYLPTIPDSVVETSSIRLSYVADIKDKREITNVTFNNHPKLDVTVTDHVTKKYWIYKLVTVTLFLEWDIDKADVLPKFVEINSIDVNYSNKSSQVVDIGNIYIYSGEASEEILEPVDCLPLYDLVRKQTYETPEKVSIEGFSDSTNKFLENEDILESLSFRFNNFDLLNSSKPISIPKGQQIEFKMKIKDITKKDFFTTSKFDFYEFRPQIILFDESGNEYFVSVYNPCIFHEFDSYDDVRKFIKRRSC